MVNRPRGPPASFDVHPPDALLGYPLKANAKSANGVDVTMAKAILWLGLTVLLATAGGSAWAQQRAWVQIEARPSAAEAEERARAWSGVFADVEGYRLASGWYGIALGPYDAAEAGTRLAGLLREGLIPRDSFIADGRRFREQFWPNGTLPQAPAETTAAPGEALPAPVEAAPLAGAPETAPEPPTLALEVPDETPAEARRSEAQLSREDRQALQTALQWFGFYRSAIDGAFGPGTRNSMADWQAANGYEATGILTTRQRAALLAGYDAAQAELGFERIVEAEAGIEIVLPMAMIEFDHYEPPFVHYRERNGSGVRVLLISEPGDQATLFGLYDIMQTLSIVPLEGERERRERTFTLTGRNATLESYSYAELSGGLIKGFTLAWNPADDERMARVLETMKASFRGVGDRALDPALAPMADAQRQGLLSGLEVRRPERSRTGFFIDATGRVLTTDTAVEGCGRITIDRDTEARVALTDAALGIAVLQPEAPLAPSEVAAFQTGAVRLGSDVAVAGYPYEDALPLPALTFGTLEDTQGLDGEAGVKRLTVDARAGDAGGPVFDGTGSVLGMLQPRADGGTRQLPAQVHYATAADRLAQRLAEAGLPVAASARQGAMAPEDLTRHANAMTVLVSCWK